MAEWEVVGGADKGGILVRKGRELNAPAEASRLSTGAVVGQLELVGERLRYRLQTGTGPAEGWVSLKITGKDLLVPRTAATAAATAEPAAALPAAAAPAASSPAAVAPAAAVGPEAGYRSRLAVDIDEWKPSGEEQGSEFQFLLQLIREDAEREQVMRYKQWDDRKRALLSRLLVRSASASALKRDNYEDISIKRTKGKKPFLASPLVPVEEAPNWNVNASHDGSWVVVASEPVCVVGIDVADTRRLDRKGQPVDDFQKKFKSQLSEREWKYVNAASGLDAQYEVFSRLWAAKEAYVKARGDGLGAFDALGACEFLDWRPLAGAPDNSAYEGTVTVKGKPEPAWRFVQHRMPGEKPHWTTVARGPFSSIVDAHGEFTATLRRRELEKSPEGWRAALDEPSPPCTVVPVGALVPADQMDGFARAGGRRWP